jgi:hypothetical protein
VTEGRPPRPLADVQDVQVRDVKHSDNGRGDAVAGSAAASIIRGSSGGVGGSDCPCRRSWDASAFSGSVSSAWRWHPARSSSTSTAPAACARPPVLSSELQHADCVVMLEANICQLAAGARQRRSGACWQGTASRGGAAGGRGMGEMLRVNCC